MNENISQRRILGFGGFLWITVGVLGIMANRLMEGINPLMIIGPLLLGTALMAMAIKGWGVQEDDAQVEIVEDKQPLSMSTREKHA